ncbi:hypothetical protein M8C21_030212 [Ambrosia artemisiifolia]|uniref:Protein N-terminal asparagine amidohydrolase n=1 Tax=Ambrosia artemisiifolia TaxID=4212 RepID=A0AAD5CHT1_AMBAR|nr:hypothetical protein M8C21_030212 [Ambrosia artemisiifolia]
MIYINGVKFLPDSSSGHDMVIALLDHPDLVAASHAFCAIPERKFSSVSDEPVKPKCVYLFQREYATVDPALVEIVGTDEATTCVGMVIRNSRTGMTCVAHLDSPDVVVVGLFQMMSLVSDRDDDNILEVHIVGAFDDAGPQVETSSGSVIPASFDASTRGPDDIIRKIRLNASFEDPGRAGRLLDTYETQTDRFVITPFQWSNRLVRYAWWMRNRPDMEILYSTSTSPSAEGPDYVENQKRVWDYLIQHPDWKQVFPSKLARVFERIGSTSWVMISET